MHVFACRLVSRKDFERLAQKAIVKPLDPKRKSQDPKTRKLQAEFASDLGPIAYDEELKIESPTPDLSEAKGGEDAVAQSPSSASEQDAASAATTPTTDVSINVRTLQRTLKRETTMVVFNRAANKASKLDFDIDKLLDAVFGDANGTKVDFGGDANDAAANGDANAAEANGDARVEGNVGEKPSGDNVDHEKDEKQAVHTSGDSKDGSMTPPPREDGSLTFEEFSEKAAAFEYEIRKLTRLFFWRLIGGMK